MKKLVSAVMLMSAFIVQAAPGPNDNASDKMSICATCHGKAGISTNPMCPNLAGQHRSYLLKQLHDFKQAKTRNSSVMSGIAATLSEEDMEKLTTFFSQQKLAEGTTPERYLKRGEQVYRGGDLDKHIAACIACHGPKGTGNGQAGFPVLSGQRAEYIVQQLKAFKEGRRKNDLNGMMQDISTRMSEDDMQAVAYYLQGLY